MDLWCSGTKVRELRLYVLLLGLVVVHSKCYSLTRACLAWVRVQVMIGMILARFEVRQPSRKSC